MYLSEVKIINFRQFKEITIPFSKGITAFVGKNDSGKTTIIDAIRIALTTRDKEVHWIQVEDFHTDTNGDIATTFSITCTFSDLTHDDSAAFAEILTYNPDETTSIVLNYSATRRSLLTSDRRWLDIKITNSTGNDGTKIVSEMRELLAATYLKPLRDAEREMSAGKSSRLSQILSQIESIHDGNSFSLAMLKTLDNDSIKELGLVGLSDLFAHHIKENKSIGEAKKNVNDKYLNELSFSNNKLTSNINFVSHINEEVRLRQVLERLELEEVDSKGNIGLGSNNILYMACELLLLDSEKEGFPILLIEEPEAHIHPQRQIRLINFLKKIVKKTENTSPVQIILTTHSPNLASTIPVENLVLITDNQAFSLAPEYTKLKKEDYKFLERFLDTTKANLFFAHGVIVVEGIAEAILLPTIAKLMGKDLTEHGVSIVNADGTGLSRYSKIFQRKDDSLPHLPIPVACITDRDIMPDCAPEILGLDKNATKRRWRMESDFTDEELKDKIAKILQHDGQNVRTFVSDKWTLEYDLAYYDLDYCVHQAIILAKNDENILEGKKTYNTVVNEARDTYPIADGDEVYENDIVKIYKPLRKKQASKAITAQYLVDILEDWAKENNISSDDIREYIPDYLLEAIDYVTDFSLTPTESGVADE